MPQYHTFTLGLEFMERNIDNDGWYLQLETFDPHEPWFSSQEFRDLYEKIRKWTGPKLDWPNYGPL